LKFIDSSNSEFTLNYNKLDTVVFEMELLRSFLILFKIINDLSTVTFDGIVVRYIFKAVSKFGNVATVFFSLQIFKNMPRDFLSDYSISILFKNCLKCKHSSQNSSPRSLEYFLIYLLFFYFNIFGHINSKSE
jgi:hypothetical protein